MPLPFARKKKAEVPGILVKCKSGRYIAYYEHRTDIIANGENEKDAKDNLRKMYKIVLEAEEAEEKEKEKEKAKSLLSLPDDFRVKHFKDNVAHA